MRNSPTKYRFIGKIFSENSLVEIHISCCVRVQGRSLLGLKHAKGHTFVVGLRIACLRATFYRNTKERCQKQCTTTTSRSCVHFRELCWNWEELWTSKKCVNSSVTRPVPDTAFLSDCQIHNNSQPADHNHCKGTAEISALTFATLCFSAPLFVFSRSQFSAVFARIRSAK